MSDYTIACNEKVNPFYYILRPNTRDAQRILTKHIGGSFHTMGNKIYAMEQKTMVSFMGQIKTHNLKVNFLRIENQGKEKINDAKEIY